MKRTPSFCNCCKAHFINNEADSITDIMDLDFCPMCAETGAAADWFWKEFIIGKD